MIALTQFLNYAAPNADAAVLFTAGDMCLQVSSDSSHLSVPKARFRAAGYFYFSDHPIDPSKPPLPTDPDPTSNGAIEVFCQSLKEVLSSASESELAALFHTMEKKPALSVHARRTRSSSTANTYPN